MRWILGFAVVVLGTSAGWVPAARAQERSSIETARAHMEQGQAYYLQGRFGEAAAEFEAAYEAEPFSAFLYNAAVAYENAGDLSRALDYFRSYLQRDPSASDRDAVEQRVARLTAELERRRAAAEAAPPPTEEGAPPAEGTPPAETAAPAVEAAPPPAALPEDFKSLVSVRTDPEGATISITQEGREVARGSSPFSYTLDQGRYHVRIEHPDFNVAEQDVTVEPGKVYVVIVNLSQGEFLGYLRVVSDVPGAQVFVDDREAGPRGRTPFEGPVPVGAHHVWIERAGYETVEQDVEVGVGEEREVRVELQRVAFGRVRVIGNVRGARVRVDGELVGTVPFEGQVPAGEHVLRVESDGMKAFEQRIAVARGQLTPVRVRLRPDVGRGGAWVASTFAVLLAGGGVALAFVAEDLRATLERERDAGTLATNDERLDHGLYYTIGADTAFGLALIVGAVGLYYLLYDPLPPSEGTVLEARDWALAPMVDPRTGTIGAAAGGRF
ncbi:PEGA domain-containing protein [Sandaracinus amylolyticus]|uniref:PEGA domain-containing protein n=1 Tax=Sandaracinus amylolyticus TaxID=927083 RepID=UPI00069F00DF|nr:PEGA domain-containing protein [Sandaracinus amylolyticus]